MGRIYSATLDGLAVTAAAELVLVAAAASTSLIIHEVKFTQDLSETSEQIKFMCYKTDTAVATRGDAGVASPLDDGDPAFRGSVRQNVLVGDISAETDKIWSESQNALNGLHILPTPETRPVITELKCFTVKVESVHTLTWSGYVIFEEIGG